MASRQKISCQEWHYETLPSSDEESEEPSTTTQLQTKRKRKQERRKHKGLTKSPRSDLLFERRRGEFRRRWSFKAIFQTLIMKVMCFQLFCKLKDKLESPVIQCPIQERSSEDGTFIEITYHQRDESAKLNDRDDDSEFSTAIENTREHSSDPDMVNGVDVLHLPNSRSQREIQHNECDGNPLQLAIPQHEKQDYASSALVTSKESYLDLHYKNKKLLQKPRFVMFEAKELLGKFLNIIVTHVVRSGRVEFCVPRQVCKIPGDKPVTVFQDRPVNDPSDEELCPEAFDPRKTLKHIIGHLPIYSPFIGVGLRDAIERVLKEISKDWLAKDLNWDSAILSMTIVEGFMEQVTIGLDSNGSPDLMESLQEYLEKIRMTIYTAKDEQHLL